MKWIYRPADIWYGDFGQPHRFKCDDCGHLMMAEPETKCSARYRDRSSPDEYEYECPNCGSSEVYENEASRSKFITRSRRKISLVMHLAQAA